MVQSLSAHVVVFDDWQFFKPRPLELIVVDDNSDDRTWAVARDSIFGYPGLQVMRREKERGLSTIVIRGWQAAKGDILGVIDTDLQHPQKKILDLWQKILNGADLAVASRHIEEGGVSEWSFIRRFLLKTAQILSLILL